MPRHSSFTLLPVAILLAACTSTAPGTVAHSLSFKVTGDSTAEFTAVGTLDHHRASDGAYAFGYRTAVNELILCARQGAEGRSHDYLILNLGVLTAPGTYSVPPGAVPGAGEWQPGILLRQVFGTGMQRSIPLTSGQAIVTSLAPESIRGAFDIVLEDSISGPQLQLRAVGAFSVATTLSAVPVICH